MSNVKLLPHNQITFDYILDFARHNRKICIPQATGTGKTYLEARILEYWNDRKAIIFAPSNEILKDTEKLLEEYDIHNYTTVTYQTFNNMHEEEISNLEVDIILFDEAHRLLAEEWYKKVQILIESHPYSLIFGLTATPIRSDGRDIREEIFENCSTHYITLAEAIVRDIVKMPVYVSALYTFDKMVDDLEQKIDSGKNSDEEKTELKKKLSVAKKNLEFSMGVPTIIKKYIPDYNGKYIVFCRDTVHLEGSIPLVNKWFREAGYEGHIFNYRIGSNFSDSDDQLETFKECDEEGLKLLFSIEKLNEGVHIPSVDGVVLLRPTNSNIIYYQQIGRCIRVDTEKRSVILDLVNNTDNIKIPLQDGIKKCIEVRKCGEYEECSQEFNVENYSIIGYLHETANVFSEIENDLILNHKPWGKEEDQFLIDFYRENGMEFCLKELKRSKSQIANRVFFLGLTGFFEWTEDKIQWLKDNYCNGISYCADYLNTTRKSVEGCAKKYGIRINKVWNDDEIIKLTQLINDGKSFKECADIMGLKENVVKNKAYRLKLLASRNWTKGEDEIIIRLYPSMGKECKKYLQNRSELSIQRRALKLNVKVNDAYSKRRKSKYRYVTFDSSKNRWVVVIDGRKFGTFKKEDDAGKVTLEKAKEYGKI